jgi:hypothetical protein
MAPFPNTIAEIDGAWLTSALRRTGRLTDDDAVALLDAQPLTKGTAFTTKMYRLTLDGPDGIPPTAVLKLPVAGEVRQLLDGIGGYVREVTFYAELARDVPLRVPECYLAEMADDSTDFVLLIEDLSDTAQADQIHGLTLQQAEIAIDDLARFHGWAAAGGRPQRYAEQFPAIDSARGIAVNEQFARFFAATWPRVLEAAGETMAADIRKLGDRFPYLMGFFSTELAQPRTIIHGELRADNLFLPADGGLLMVDFQTTGQAAGMQDVSYLVSQSLASDVRHGHDTALARRYWEGLCDAGVTGYSWEDAWRQYRVGVLFNLIYPGMAFQQYELTNDRGKQLLRQMLGRSIAAIMDNECLELIR